jgi:hypothetical protein
VARINTENGHAVIRSPGFFFAGHKRYHSPPTRRGFSCAGRVEWPGMDTENPFEPPKSLLPRPELAGYARRFIGLLFYIAAIVPLAISIAAVIKLSGLRRTNSHIEDLAVLAVSVLVASVLIGIGHRIRTKKST